jgi:DeoR family fructose operon transcriptional repressor
MKSTSRREARFVLTEERHDEILKIVNSSGAVSVQELVAYLNASESTVRRDLLILQKAGKLNKVHGGATSLGVSHADYRADMEDLRDKYSFHMAEKCKIAHYAATLIGNDDFVYIDAGSTTEQMSEFLAGSRAEFMTNSIPIAQKLARKGLRVYILPGRVKCSTESIVGGVMQELLQRYHFTIGFFGTNGLSVANGCTTPDSEEAVGKRTALQRCSRCYVLADSSKFGLSSHITFADLKDVEVITVQTDDGFDYGPYETITGVRIL